MLTFVLTEADMLFSPHIIRSLGRRLEFILVLALAFAGFLITTPTGADAQAGGTHFALSASGTGVVCDPPNEPNVCTVPEGGSFSLAVNMVSPPAGGYIAIQSQLYVGSFVWTPASVEAENVWPDNQLPLRNPSEPGPTTVIAHGGLTSTSAPFPASNHEGALVQIQLTCPSGVTTGDIALIAYDQATAPLGAAWTLPDTTTNATAAIGTAAIDTDQDGNPNQVPIADTLAIRCGETAPLVTPGESLPGYTPGPPSGQTPPPNQTSQPGQSGTPGAGGTPGANGTQSQGTAVASPTPGSGDDDDDGGSMWLIIGIIVAVVVVGGAGAGYIWYRRRNRAA